MVKFRAAVVINDQIQYQMNTAILGVFVILYILQVRLGYFVDTLQDTDDHCVVRPIISSMDHY